MTRENAADLIKALPLHTPFENIQEGDIVISDCENLPEKYRFSADTAVEIGDLTPLVVERINGDKTGVKTLGGMAYTVGTPSMLLVYSPRVMADAAQAPSISQIVDGIKAFDYWRGASAWEKGDKRRIYFSGGNIWNTKKVKINAFLEFEDCKVTLKIWVDSAQTMAWKESQKKIVADQLEYAAAFAAAVWNCAHIVEDAASAEDAATPEDVVVVDDVAEETKPLEAEKMDKVEVFINELAKKMTKKTAAKRIKHYGSVEELEKVYKMSYQEAYNQIFNEWYSFYKKTAKNIQEGNPAKFIRTINSLNPETKEIYAFITGDKLPDTEKGKEEYFRKKYPEYYIALENEKKTNSVTAPTQTFADYRIKPDTMQSPQKVAAENMNPTPTIVSEMLLPSLDGMKAHAKNVTITDWVERRKASGISLPLTQPERDFVAQYTGGGGLNETGYGKGVLSEYYTPYEVVNVMVELAKYYGYKSEPNTVLEPSCGTGRFLAHFPEGGEAYEISPVSHQIAAWLYPQFDVKLADFSTKFTDARKHFPVKEQYNLVIGNPPYGKFDGFYAPAEKRIIDTDKVEEYFMARCLDVLKPGGLLVFIIGCEPKNGGISFLRKGDSKVKQRIAKAADLLCAYRIPPKLFPTTDVMSEIIVLRKK